MSEDEQRSSKLPGDVAEDNPVLGKLRPRKDKAARPWRQPPRASQAKRTNTVGQPWVQGGGAISGEAVTSALNVHSWQSGRINEKMTLEQYCLDRCNSQQVEEGGRWDKHLSSNLHDQQMEGQDQWKWGI